jgi:hypothetical protein
MSEGYALRYLSRVMNWDFDEDDRETRWLRTISEFKYDSYRDFLAGSRFPEALLNWLQQFDPTDRPAAYLLFRKRLIFISWAEINQLVCRTLPAYGRQVIVKRASEKSGVAPYLVWSSRAGRKQIDDILKRTLFIGLSDGARIDAFRRANAGEISNEQVTLGYEISPKKWTDLHDELGKRTADRAAKFEVLFLIDDFSGSGKTLLREKPDGTWGGKLNRFAEDFNKHRTLFADDCAIAVHHYIGTPKSQKESQALLERVAVTQPLASWLPQPIQLSFDLIIPETAIIQHGNNKEIDDLLHKYYDSNVHLKSKSLPSGGAKDARYGFAECGLPVVIEHNTPNNSLALFWAESVDDPPVGEHAMRPLFRRRQRHT